MRAVKKILSAGTWAATAANAVVSLPYVDRYRRRIALTSDDGRRFLLDLPAATVLRDGDGLLLDDGAIVAVRAADEEVCDVMCGSPEDQARFAWHLGNRHLAVEILSGRLRIRDDHVIVDMLRGLGARVERRRAPFNPERGAYQENPHDHGHDERHHRH